MEINAVKFPQRVVLPRTFCLIDFFNTQKKILLPRFSLSITFPFYYFIHSYHIVMVEPMDIDQNGVSGHATPAESIAESSIKREDTPESTEVSSPS
jgi:hypothetical protein